MAMFEFRRRSTRRRWVFIGTGTTLVAALLLIVAAATANLAGSTFEGNDGNLVVNTAGNTDWANVAGREHRHRQGFAASSDNAFGQGTKEDNANVTVVDGLDPAEQERPDPFLRGVRAGRQRTHLSLSRRGSGWSTSAMPTSTSRSTRTRPPDSPPTRPDRSPSTAPRATCSSPMTSAARGTPTLGLLNSWLTAGAGNTASQCFSATRCPAGATGMNARPGRLSPRAR